MRLHLPVVALMVALAGLAACGTDDNPTSPSPPPSPSSASPLSSAPPPSSAPSPAPTTSSPISTPALSTSPRTVAPKSTAPAASAKTSAVAEPTTTNTLPPPPRPSRPAPSTAGGLSAEALPVPAGWKPVNRAGGSEEGYQGNGTWVHARDPRYAAHGVLTLGCKAVTRDDYADPVHALEGTYAGKNGEPGIGLVLQFSTAKKAATFYTLYVQQVRACRSPDGPVVTTIIPSSSGLIDRRTYPDGKWTEVAARVSSRLTLVILSDPRHRITAAQAEAMLGQIRAR